MKRQTREDEVSVNNSFMANFMRTDVICVDQDTPIMEVALTMSEQQVADVVVTKLINNKIKPVGLITDRDLIMSLVNQHTAAEFLRASDLMTRPVRVVYDTDDIHDMIKVMQHEGLGRLPIVDSDGDLMGIITAKKILQLLAQEFYELTHRAKRKNMYKTVIEH